MSFSGTVYTAALHLATLVARSAVRLPAPVMKRDGKRHQGLRGLLDAGSRIEAWAREERDPSRPLVWFHASSVGEGLQARAVIEALRSLQPGCQFVYTHFSPSAAPLAGKMPVDLAGYLPVDLPRRMARALDALRPAAVVFSKNEVWPNLVREAETRGIPALLLSATLPASSSRMRGPASALLRETHARLAAVGAISADDARRYEEMGVASSRIFVMGDARFDQVHARMRRVDRGSPLLELLRGESGTATLVAGSTWPADEDALLRAVAGLRDSGDRLRLIVAPHEPSREALERFEKAAAALGLGAVRLADLERGGSGESGEQGGSGTGASSTSGESSPPGSGRAEAYSRGRTRRADITLIDRVGILGDLYALADLAFVGGGFGTAGLHSVLEPAAFGVPVAFGPRHSNAREAGEMVRRGAAGTVSDGKTLEGLLREWIRDEAGRRSAGEAGAAYVRENLGAAERGARAVIQSLDRSRH